MAISMLNTRSSVSIRPTRPSSSCCTRPSRLVCVVPRASKGKADEDNPYHNRETTKSGHSHPAGSKDAYVKEKDKDDQFAYQQERLEWRKKNQFDGVEDRQEPAHNNMAKDMSAERRGPDVADTSGHGDTLKELVQNVTESFTGKKHKDDK